ncbi:MAG: hypothetical protein N3G21_02085, partial [Candidatus Hydrogenedentes bacterium]|nr:hypothetical protein [Candidatus Hydrogenedentota bacterium]
DEHQKRLIYEYYGESTVIPDKVVIPLHLQPRTYTILTKVTNNKNQWGITARLTDSRGNSIIK